MKTLKITSLKNLYVYGSTSIRVKSWNRSGFKMNGRFHCNTYENYMSQNFNKESAKDLYTANDTVLNTT